MQSFKFEKIQSVTTVRYLSLAAFSVLLILLLYHFLRYLIYVALSITYPFQLDYGEGIVWQQALFIPGKRMYGDINTYPFIVFHYPPFYHSIVKVVTFFGINYLIAGRSLSVLSTVAIAILAFFITRQAIKGTVSRYIGLFAATVAALTLFTYMPLILWSPWMRVDMLAIALSFLGVYLAIRSVERPLLSYGAALAFVFALYTKQTMLAAPMVVGIVLLLINPKQTLKAATFGLIVSLLALLYLSWKTNGGFIHHTIQYNINTFNLIIAIKLILQLILEYLFYIIVVIVTVYIGWRQILLTGSKLNKLEIIREKFIGNSYFLILAIFTFYFIISFSSLIAVGKSGASSNYFIEWMCTWSVIIGIAVGHSLQLVEQSESVRRIYMVPAISIGLPLALLSQVWLTPIPYGPSSNPVKSQHTVTVLEKIRDARKPVLSEDMVLLMKAGKEVPLEPAIFSELARMGYWNQQQFIELIKARFFEFVVISTDLSSPRFTPAMREAIMTAYPKVEKFSPYRLYLPSD